MSVQRRAATARQLPAQSGQAIAIFALLLPVLTAMLALLIDGSYLYGERRAAQNAADSAALAAALAVGASNDCSAGNNAANTQANLLAQQNGAQAPALTFTLLSAVTDPSSGQRLPVCQVATQTAVASRPFLSGMLGQSSLHAQAGATAALAGLAQYSNAPSGIQAPLLPVAIDVDSFSAYGYGTTLQQFLATQAGPNGYYWFVLPSDKCDDLTVNNYVTAATTLTVQAGTDVQTCALEDDMALDSLQQRAPVLRTAVLTHTDQSGAVVALGFVYLYVEAAEHGPGIQPAIYGYFVNVKNPTPGSIGLGTTPNYGVYNVGLVK
jgi:hypothetical protein